MSDSDAAPHKPEEVREKSSEQLETEGDLDDKSLNSHRLAALMAQHLPIVVWTTDRELRFTSSMGAGLVGLESLPDEVRGVSLHEYFSDPREATVILQAHRAVLAGGQRTYETEWSGHHYESHVRPLRDAAGTVRGCIGFALDITERKQSERALRESEARFRRLETQKIEAVLKDSEERYRLLADNSTDMICRQTLHGVLLYVSPASQTLLGYAPDDLVGRSFGELVHPEHREPLEHFYATLRNGPGTASVTLRVLRRDGREGWLEVTARVADSVQSSDQQEVVAVSRDVSARVEADRVAQNLRNDLAHVARLSTMGELATGLAHELMQPLTTIVGFAEGSLRKIMSPAACVQDLQYPLQEIVAQSQFAAEIIRRLRDFIRQNKENHAPFSLNSLTRDVIGMLESDFREQQIHLRLHLEPEKSVLVGDHIQIQQVLLNLIRNALEAMREAGTKRRVLEIRTTPLSKEEIAFSVGDTGPGVAVENHVRLFQPFFTTKPTGLGLGLSISRAIVEAHRGRMWATPRSPHGMTFHFSLPLTQSSASHDRISSAPSQRSL